MAVRNDEMVLAASCKTQEDVGVPHPGCWNVKDVPDDWPDPLNMCM